MKTSYWGCPYSDYEEWHDGDRRYWCKHPCAKVKACELDNKYGDDEAECPLLDIQEPPRTR